MSRASSLGLPRALGPLPMSCAATTRTCVTRAAWPPARGAAGCASFERLLEAKFAGGPVVVSELRTDDIRQFIADQLDALGTTSNAISIAWALRAYLRYRASLGDAVQRLRAVITSPANWSMARLPRGLTSEEVERLLSSFTPALPSPCRGYAVVRLALDLGLRGIEISRLQLADINWREGTVTLKGTKPRRQELLPLPTMHWPGPGGLPPSRTTQDQRYRGVRAPHCAPRPANRRRRHPQSISRRVSASGHTAWPRSCPATHLGLPDRQPRRLDQGGGRCTAPPIAGHRDDLRQG